MLLFKVFVKTMVPEKLFDRCVDPKCGKTTKYLITDPIEIRTGYMEGAGQLCPNCFRELYAAK
jgi:hypothetical protein